MIIDNESKHMVKVLVSKRYRSIVLKWRDGIFALLTADEARSLAEMLVDRADKLEPTKPSAYREPSYEP